MVYSRLIGFIAVLPLCAEQKITSTSTRIQPPPAELPSYNVLRTDQGIHIDGHSKETDWQLAPTLDFIMPWSDLEKEGAQSTIARLLWDDDYLYIVYECVDPYLDAEVETHDGPVYREDAVEIFATANAAQEQDGITYFGYEMNIKGTLLDYIAFGGGDEWTSNIHFPWQSEGVQIATSFDGTLNDHTDVDQGWILEIAIPHDNFRHLGGQIPPRDGDIWRAGLNRTAGHQGQHGLWSDTHSANASFHHATRFGKLIFSAKTIGD